MRSAVIEQVDPASAPDTKEPVLTRAQEIISMDQLIVRRRIAAALIVCSACASDGSEPPDPALTAQSLVALSCAADAPDDDADGLCNDAEIEIGTDPSDPDSDGDALKDGDEVLGYREDGVLVLDLPALGADPRHKDIFLEIDYYAAFRPSPGVIEAVIEGFALAPVANPDNTTGIRLHVDLDQQISQADEKQFLDYEFAYVDELKAKYFDPARTVAYHYGLFADRYVQPDGSTDSSGLSDGIIASDFIVTLGEWTDRSVRVQAGTLMHELGHNLGLKHGGNDHFPFKPHYFSLMNYHYQVIGVTKDGRTTFDYARIPVASLDENNLNESQGITPQNNEDALELARYAAPYVCAPILYGCFDRKQLAGRLPGPLDFDRDNGIDSTPVAFDLDGDETLEYFEALDDDWRNLNYKGGKIGDLTRSRQMIDDSPPCLRADQLEARAP
jgi:hypothetical protein